MAVIPRRYSNDAREDAAQILADIVTKGASKGWGGSLEQLDRLSEILKNYNVFYVDDFNGTWEMRLQNKED